MRTQRKSQTRSSGSTKTYLLKDEFTAICSWLGKARLLHKLDQHQAPVSSRDLYQVDDDIGRADDAVFVGTSERALPHPHHVVGDIALQDAQMLFGREVRFHLPVKVRSIHETIVHRD